MFLYFSKSKEGSYRKYANNKLQVTEKSDF